jgi:uncharacterized membrane protein
VLTLVPIGALRLAVGSLLLVFGLQWFRKGIRRVSANGFRGSGARVGTLLLSFGTCWAVEGLGVAWPGGDTAILALAAWYVLAAAGYIRLLRRHPAALVLTHFEHGYITGDSSSEEPAGFRAGRVNAEALT